MRDHELHCSPDFVISQGYHGTSELKEHSFLLSSARLPTPVDLLHKCLRSPLHLYIFIDSALEKVPYYFIVSQIAQTFKVKSPLHLHLRFECWNDAEYIEMIISPTAFGCICGQWISICKFSVQLSCWTVTVSRWKWKIANLEWEQKRVSFFSCLWIIFFFFNFFKLK